MLKTFSLQGRLGRLRYFLFNVAVVAIAALAVTALTRLMALVGDRQALSMIHGMVALTYVLAIIASLCLMVRRLHDFDQSGWWTPSVFLLHLVQGYFEAVDSLIAAILTASWCWRSMSQSSLPLARRTPTGLARCQAPLQRPFRLARRIMSVTRNLGVAEIKRRHCYLRRFPPRSCDIAPNEEPPGAVPAHLGHLSRFSTSSSPSNQRRRSRRRSPTSTCPATIAVAVLRFRSRATTALISVMLDV